MVEYQETPVSGDSLHRFNKIVIDNRFQLPITFACFEQEVITVGSDFLEKDVGLLFFAYDAAQAFELYDPDTGLPTGVMAVGFDVRKLLYSYIKHAVLERDHPNADLVAFDDPDTLVATASVSVIGDLTFAEGWDTLSLDAVVGILAGLGFTEDLDTLAADLVVEILGDLGYEEIEDELESDGEVL